MNSLHQDTSPNNSYTTSTSAGEPKYVVWANQLNITYSLLEVTNSSHGKTIQPDVSTYHGGPAINGTMVIAIMDDNPYLMAFNFSDINPHAVAGPALYQAVKGLLWNEVAFHLRTIILMYDT